jgi:hypothetical protein
MEKVKAGEVGGREEVGTVGRGQGPVAARGGGRRGRRPTCGAA